MRIVHRPKPNRTCAAGCGEPVFRQPYCSRCAAKWPMLSKLVGGFTGSAESAFAQGLTRVARTGWSGSPMVSWSWKPPRRRRAVRT